MTEFVGPIRFRACTNCGASKPLEVFSRKPNGGFGRQPFCKPCQAACSKSWYAANPEKVAANNKIWQAANPAKVTAYRRSWYAVNVEKAAAKSKAWYAANPERLTGKSKAWYAAHPEKAAIKNKAWREEHPSTMAAHASRRRASKLKATPPWADPLKIAEIFKQACPKKFDVDHIYPLKGITVSGLHVEANLRPLCRRENGSKGNKLPGFLAHELWDPTGSDVYHETMQ